LHGRRQVAGDVLAAGETEGQGVAADRERTGDDPLDEAVVQLATGPVA
jgi:hypothetical protein